MEMYNDSTTIEVHVGEWRQSHAQIPCGQLPTILPTPNVDESRPCHDQMPRWPTPQMTILLPSNIDEFWRYQIYYKPLKFILPHACANKNISTNHKTDSKLIKFVSTHAYAEEILNERYNLSIFLQLIRYSYSQQIVPAGIECGRFFLIVET